MTRSGTTDESDEDGGDSMYTSTELMITTAAAELQNDESVLVGIGLPNLACNLAKQTHAPGLRMVYESGTIDSDPASLPLSIADPVLATGAVAIEPMFETFSKFLQGDRIDVGFLGGAQIDRFGNINSTVIGDYDEPTVRLPGSGGACEIASNAHRTLVITPLQRRRFPESVDFITSPGYVGGREHRRSLGLRGGPDAVITDKAVLRFAEDGEMYVASLHPGTDTDDVQRAIGWDIQFAEDLERTPLPRQADIRLLRDELDPDGIYTAGHS